MTLQQWAEANAITVGTSPSVHVVCDDRDLARTLYRLEDFTVRTKSGPTYWLVAKTPPKKFALCRDGVPTGFEGTRDDCWLKLHKLSWGASVQWLLDNEGYSIVPVGALQCV